MNGVKIILRGKRGNAEYLAGEYTFHQGTSTSQRGNREEPGGHSGDTGTSWKPQRGQTKDFLPLPA